MTLNVLRGLQKDKIGEEKEKMEVMTTGDGGMGEY